MTDEDAPPDIFPLDHYLTHRLARIQSKLNAQVSRILREQAGITSTQWRIIALLGSHGSCTSAQLSRMASMDKGLVSRTVKSLQAANLVTASRKASDNRAMYLDLTARGRAIFDRTMPRMEARQVALESYLAETQSEALKSAFDCLERAAEDPAI